MFFTVAENLTSLCALMLIGYAAGKAKILDERAGGVLADVLLKIALPCTIIMSMQREFSFELLTKGLTVLFVSLGVYFASLWLGVLLCKILRVEGEKADVWRFAAMFPNVGYMGFPVLGAVYGDEVLFFVSMNNIVFNILSSTFGVSLIKGGVFRNREEKPRPKAARLLRPRFDKRLDPTRLNLLPLATFLGFALFLLSAEIPEPIADALKMGGNMTTPLSMIIIGALISRSGLLSVFKMKKEYALIFLRLLIIPGLTYYAVSPFLRDAHMTGVLTLLSGMPIAAVSAIFAAKYTDEGVFASKIVALSTVASLGSLPLVALLLK